MSEMQQLSAKLEDASNAAGAILAIGFTCFTSGFSRGWPLNLCANLGSFLALLGLQTLLLTCSTVCHFRRLRFS